MRRRRASELTINVTEARAGDPPQAPALGEPQKAGRLLPFPAEPSGGAASSDPAALARAYLAERGISEALATANGLQAISAEESAALGYAGAPALKIPYRDVTGREAGFYRLRYLEELPGWAGLAEKPRRYVQPADTAPEPYFPAGPDWRTIQGDARTPLVITEGEIKSIAMTAAGFPTTGLGGVDNWQSRKRGMSFLPALAAFQWKGREVVILIDYDPKPATQRNVLRAANALARELGSRGADVKIARIPAGPDPAVKVGADDCLLAHSAAAMAEVLNGAVPAKCDDLLYMLGTESFYWRSADSDRFNLGAPLAQDGARRALLDAGYSADAAKATLIHPAQHLFAHGLDSLPGEPELVVRAGQSVYNAWIPPSVEPKRGEFPTIREILVSVTGGEIAGSTFAPWYVANSLAYKTQNPAARPGVALAFWGAPGTGKTVLFWNIMSAILGVENCVVLAQADLDSPFNARLAGKVWAVGNEVALPGTRREVAAQLKALVTDPFLRVEGKGVNALQVPNRLAWVLTSNEPPVVVESADRRYSVFQQSRPPTAAFRAACAALFKPGTDEWSERGAAEISAFTRYLHHFKCSAYAARTPFENVARREAMIATRPPVENFADEVAREGLLAVAGQSGLEGWVRAVRDESRAFTAPGADPRVPCDLVYRFYEGWCERGGHGRPKSSTAFGAAFGDAWAKVTGRTLVRERVRAVGNRDRRAYCYILPLDPPTEGGDAE